MANARAFMSRYVTELQLCYIRPELSGVERALVQEAAGCTRTVHLKIWVLLDGTHSWGPSLTVTVARSYRGSLHGKAAEEPVRFIAWLASPSSFLYRLPSWPVQGVEMEG